MMEVRELALLTWIFWGLLGCAIIVSIFAPAWPSLWRILPSALIGIAVGIFITRMICGLWQ